MTTTVEEKRPLGELSSEELDDLLERDRQTIQRLEEGGLELRRALGEARLAVSDLRRVIAQRSKSN